MKLLVSVRSAEEALAALEGGADLIDVKEPSRGSLGRADDATIAEVIEAVGARRSVSAAFGELLDLTTSPKRERALFALSYVKWGLADCAHHPHWSLQLDTVARQLPPNCRPVAVAYADWERAQSPSPGDVCDFACNHRWGAFLLDTWQKDETTLLDHLAPKKIARLLDRCRDAGVPVALAGSLGLPQIETLSPLAPNWFAVRGAVCREGDRGGLVDVERVRRLVELLCSIAGGSTNRR